MQTSNMLDETSSLADSAYELISSTDGESQDGREPDSLAASITSSFNIYPRADDVLSLNGHEATYDDNEEDEEEEEEDEDASPGQGYFDQGSGYLPTQTRNTPGHSQLYNAGDDDGHAPGQSSPADSIRYAEQALCNPSTQSLSSHEYDSSHGDISGGRSLLNQSIEFNEGTNIKPNLEKISVKHTIRELSEGETALVAATMGMAADHPNRMAATICQTMSRHCLSTREPLRVLYVGSDAASSDIMHKISSAILASGSTPGNVSSDREHRHSSNRGIYNIMPISSFGSAKVPELDEIQLMGVSDFYIKFERCVRAKEIVYKGEAFPNDTVYAMELDSGKSHMSVFSPSGSTITPPWTLPHVAIFYVSGNDDKQTETTRDAAWEFMTRHAVPSVFISHSQSFSRSSSAGRWQNFVDQSAVHLCLESRDPAKPMAPERLPIDLTSFLNIDARQMNRNLAYLTGLKDVPKLGQKNGSKTAGRSQGDTLVTVIPHAARSFLLFAKGEDWHPEARRAAAAVVHNMWKIFLSLLSVTTIGVVLSMDYPILPRLQQMVSYNQNTVPSVLSTVTPTTKVDQAHATPVTSALPRITVSVPPIVPAVTLSYTTTKTAQAPISEQTSSTSQVLFGGYLTDNAHNQHSKGASDTKIMNTGCSIEVYSSHEILVKVPAATKTKWLAKGAIDIDVWQGQKMLKSKLSTSDEGIIIELDRKDAVGVMNVSIVTTRKPKINETFAVDFGQPSAARLWETGLSLWKESMRTAADAGFEAALQARKAFSDYADEQDLYHLPAQVAADGASWLVNRVTLNFMNYKRDARRFYRNHLTNLPVNKSVEKYKMFLKGLAPTLDAAHKVRDDVHLTVLRAQVASKLWWLRAQGKMQEYAVYEKKAAEYIRQLELAAKDGQKTTGTENIAPDMPATAIATPDKPAGWLW
ncbi:hypothetical protein SBRCBS47491_006755 [Sporothrix bragantina]|uniref:Uncharacterized protein n=1 Tax=Sporothrix bragantina TaxID=671064 RepID=A0ABP0C7K6_9PEZI